MAVVWVLDVTQVVIFHPFGSGVIAIVDSDVVAVISSLGCKRGGGGWGACRGAVGRPSSVCHHSRVVGGWFKAGGKVVVVVVADDNVIIVDGGCVGVISGDVAMLAGKGGLVMRAVGLCLVWVGFSNSFHTEIHGE
jgi:hypothetical protein